MLFWHIKIEKIVILYASRAILAWVSLFFSIQILQYFYFCMLAYMFFIASLEVLEKCRFEQIEIGDLDFISAAILLLECAF